MSTTQQPGRKTIEEASDLIDLGGARRKWLWPAVGAVVVLALALFLVFKFTGDDEKTVAGSHFGNDFEIAYQASSASEKAFLDYLDKEIAPDYGVTIKGVGIEDGNQLDQATADGKYIANIYQH
jgi:ABC-type metal ion transport system substrate-binding protein